MIPCELDLASTTFCDTTILTYDIELTTSVNKIDFNLLNDENFTTPYINDTIKNSPTRNHVPTQAKTKVCIININGEYLITDQGSIDELNFHQATRVKSKVNISLCRRNSYQRTDLEEIHYIFDQDRPVVSHLEVCLPK